MGNTESSAEIKTAPAKKSVYKPNPLNHSENKTPKTAQSPAKPLFNRPEVHKDSHAQMVSTNNYDTPVYEHTGERISDGMNSYQYYKPDIPVQDTTGRFGSDSQKDNKYSENVTNLYKSNLRSREQSGDYRASLLNPSPFTENIESNNKDSGGRQGPSEAPPVNTVTMMRSDALDIRDAKYLTNLEKRIMIMNNILLEHVDPLSVMGIEAQNLSNLKNKYISLRNIYHPDKRNSNTDLFIQVTKAIESHNLILKSCIMDKDFIQLRKGYSNYNDNEEKKKPIFIKNIKSVTTEGFNKLYEENKFDDEYDEGYGDLMVESGVREDIDIERTVKNDSEFNTVFNKNLRESSRDIVEYTIPEAINNYTYNNLCEKKTDYSGGSSGGLGYKDYKNAFELENIDDTCIKPQLSYKKYKETRETDPLTLTEEQNQAIELEELRKEKLDASHEDKLHDYSLRISEYHSKSNINFLE